MSRSAAHRAAGCLLLAALVAGSAFAGWRIVAITRADALAASQPEAALRWIPDHPQARLLLAERALAAGDLPAARTHARRLLATEPLEGRGFRVLAAAADRDGDTASAQALYQIAARRSPRDVATQAWLAERALLDGHYGDAMARIDVMLRVAPAQRAVLLPLLAQLAVDPGFADALATALAPRPPWRGSVLAALLSAEDPRGADQVLSGLRRAGGLDDAEFDAWIAALMRRGDWGQAYARWVGTLDLAGAPLPLVFNGDFSRAVSGRGFDWRTTRVPGVALQFVDGNGGSGTVAHARFRGRAVARLNLEQPLLLAPGRYRFSARMRASALRSEAGLVWTLHCRQSPRLVTTSAPVGGTFGWRQVTMAVDIPAEGCDGQWLQLRNPVPAGSAQRISGDLWIDDVQMSALR